MRLTRTVAATTVAVLLAATACGGDDSDNASDTPGSSATKVQALYDALPESVKKSGVLRFAGDSHPPYRIVGTDGKTVTGIDKDFQVALEKILGVRTEISIVQGLPAALSGMLADRYDAFNGPVRATAEREKDFDAVVWMVTRTAYLIPKANKSGIKKTDDLCGKKVAGVAGSVVEEQVKKLTDWCTKNGKAAINFIGLADTNATILAAKAGRADAAGMTQAAAIDAKAAEKDAYDVATQTDEQGAGVDQLALLTPKSKQMGQVMLDAYKELFKSGEYKRIMEKWELTDVMVPEPKLNVATSGG